MRSNPSRSTAFAMGGLAILGAGYFALLGPVLFGRAVPAVRDQAAYYWPVKSLFALLARESGGVPVWNPFLASGQPFAANPEHAVFHPLSALFLFLPFPLAFRLQVLLPVAAAAAAAFFLGRCLRLDRLPSLFLAVSWAYGGYVLSTVNLLPILFAVAALPAAMGCAALIGRSRGERRSSPRAGRLARAVPLRALAGLGASFGLVVLAGEPSTLLMSAPLLLVAFFHGRVLEPPEETPARGLLFLTAGLLLGVGIGAALLVPGIDHARKTVRARGLDSVKAADWSFPPVRLAELVVPDLCRVDSTDPEMAAFRTRLYPGRRYPFLFSLYPGFLVTAFALAAWRRPRAAERGWLAVAALGFLLGCGSHLPVWRLAHLVPPLNGLRYPEKFLLLLAAAVTVGGACGFQSFLDASPPERRRFAAKIALAAAVFGAMAALSGVLGVVVIPGAPRLVTSSLFARQAFVALLASASLLLATRDRARVAGAFLAVALTAADLAASGRRLLFLEPLVELKAAPPQIASLLSRPLTGYLAHLADHHGQLYTILGTAAPPIPAQWRIPTALDRDFDLTELAWSAEATTTVLKAVAEVPSARVAIFRRRSIATLLHFRPGVDTDPSAAVKIPLAQLLQLSYVPDPMPFAFAARRLRIVDGAAGWRAAMEALGPDAADTACVERADAAGLPLDVTPASVTLVERRPDRLVLDVAAAGRAFLCVNQTWDSTWRATVDEAPARVVKTDLSLTGVDVPAGRHRVTLFYRNRWIDAGVAVSLGSLFAAALLARRARKAPEAESAISSRS